MMSIPTAAKSPRRERQPPPVILPDELITEILSFLSVKALMRLRCMSKFWNTLISNDPTFVKTHLNRSKRNPHLSLFYQHRLRKFRYDCFDFNPFPIRRLLDDNPSITITLFDDRYYRLDKNKDCSAVIGCCNGLFCLLGSFSSPMDIDDQEFWLYFWNPATRTISEKLGSFTCINYGWDPWSLSSFAFGYDVSTDTYKVVAINIWREEVKEVRVFILGDNIWRNIQCFPVVPVPLTLDSDPCSSNDGVYLSGTLNWLAIRINITTVEQFVIISLDLGTETYLQLLPPRGFVEVPKINPTICVLSMDCLCFCHDDLGNDLFVIWKMTEFRVEDSWTLLLKISYQNLQMKYFHSPWMRLSENGDTLILTNSGAAQVVIYNRRDNRVEQTVNIEQWPFFVEDYVESLVSTC